MTAIGAPAARRRGGSTGGPSAGVDRRASPDGVPATVPIVSAVGVVLIVAGLVATTPIGSGDYGQWLMVARSIVGDSVPSYRALGDVPPLVPSMIAAGRWLTGDPVLALHLVAGTSVAALGLAFFAAGVSITGKFMAGLLAAVAGLLVTDEYLNLLAFGGLLQAVATATAIGAVAAFGRALLDPARERRWWGIGAAATAATCLSHVPTATITMPVVGVIAGLSAVPDDGVPLARRVRQVTPLAVVFAALAGYWVLVVGPASLGLVANPASLSYRGPERALELLLDDGPTAVVAGVGAAVLTAWSLVRLASPRRLRRRDPGLALAAWAVTWWGAFAVSAMTEASTDYPRFVPLLLAPLVVAAAWSVTALTTRLAGWAPRRARPEAGLVAIGLVVVLVAPFTIAGFQTRSAGYELPDASALRAVAAWTSDRVVPGATVLAPTREAKWLEGYTGRDALFSSDVRYAFRPVEWDRSLAADAILRGTLTLASPAFELTLTDAAPGATGQVPRSIVIGMNHGGEFVDVLRTVPSSTVVLDTAGEILASQPALAPDSLAWAAAPTTVGAAMRWTGERHATPLALTADVSAGATEPAFLLDLRVTTSAAVGGLRTELRPLPGSAIVDVMASAGSAVVTFARLGRAEPRLRLTALGATFTPTDGGVVVETARRELLIEVTDLTSGGASTGLRVLDPARLVDDYRVGAVVLRRDPSYDARRTRLEALGFHVGTAIGPYVVLVTSEAAIPAHRDPSP